MESSIFNTITDFNKQYEALRNDILKRHGYEKGAKVRLKNAITLYQKFNDNWIKTTSIKSDMIDRIKTYNSEGEFKLKAMV